MMKLPTQQQQFQSQQYTHQQQHNNNHNNIEYHQQNPPRHLLQSFAHQQQISLSPTNVHIGKIQQICHGYYSNPQLYIFLPTFIISIVLAIVMITQVFIDGYHYYIGRFMVVYVLYRYLNLAFSNPGLARLNIIKILQNYRYCNICNIYVRKYTRHCQLCDVCIEGYDHHCVFIGKCIGLNNMGQFKEFLCMMFTTMVYGLIVSIITATNIQKVGNS